jgi:hypothetical protein
VLNEELYSLQRESHRLVHGLATDRSIGPKAALVLVVVLGSVGLYHRGALMPIAVPAIREGVVHLYYAAADVGW